MPSAVLEKGNSFDLYVLDVGAKWRNHQHDVANGKVLNAPKPRVHYTQEELQAMIDNVRNSNVNNSN